MRERQDLNLGPDTDKPPPPPWLQQAASFRVAAQPVTLSLLLLTPSSSLRYFLGSQPPSEGEEAEMEGKTDQLGQNDA